MEVQTIINILILVSGSLCGWVLKSITSSVQELQSADKCLAEKVSEIEVLVAGSYCKRDDLEKMSNAIFAKLDRIENKLDSKQDK